VNTSWISGTEPRFRANCCSSTAQRSILLGCPTIAVSSVLPDLKSLRRSERLVIESILEIEYAKHENLPQTFRLFLPNFCRRCDEKLRNFAPIFDSSRLWFVLVSKESKIIKIKKNFRIDDDRFMFCPNLIHPCEARKKTAPFYFCNSFTKTSSITTIFGTHLLQ